MALLTQQRKIAAEIRVQTVISRAASVRGILPAYRIGQAALWILSGLVPVDERVRRKYVALIPSSELAIIPSSGLFRVPCRCAVLPIEFQ